MTVTIFGATGMVGKELVNQCLIRGFKVRAFGRNVFTAGFPENENLELIRGALLDPGEVYHALEGSDAVFSAIGGSVDGTDRARSLGMKNIISEMEKAGVRRILAVGGMGVLDDGAGDHLVHGPDYPVRFRAVGEEHLKAWQALDKSTLNYTFVCCPDILNESASGHFRTTADTPPEPNHYRISKGDLALFMINELEKREYVRKRVGISN